MNNDLIDVIDWKKLGDLVPAIIQDANTGSILMHAYMNKTAIMQTLETQKVTFYSRSKQRLWVKGESSGNFLNLVSIVPDCDKDTLLIQAIPEGPTCHTGARNCFDYEPAHSFLNELECLIQSRKQSAQDNSYTQQLFASGVPRIAQKVGEEGLETALAAVCDGQDMIGEAADLIYHLLVLLAAKDSSLQAVLAVLRDRHQAMTK